MRLRGKYERESLTIGREGSAGFDYQGQVAEEDLNRLVERVELPDGRVATHTREWGTRRYAPAASPREVQLNVEERLLAWITDVFWCFLGLLLLLLALGIGAMLGGAVGMLVALLLFVIVAKAER